LSNHHYEKNRHSSLVASRRRQRIIRLAGANCCANQGGKMECSQIYAKLD